MQCCKRRCNTRRGWHTVLRLQPNQRAVDGTIGPESKWPNWRRIGTWHLPRPDFLCASGQTVVTELATSPELLHLREVIGTKIIPVAEGDGRACIISSPLKQYAA